MRNSSLLPVYDAPRAEIIDDALRFDSDDEFRRALSVGFFLLRIPQSMCLRAADEFATGFHLDLKYRSLTATVLGDPLLGFHRRKDQIEQFLLEKRLWKQYYPASLATLGDSLCELSAIIVRSVLNRVGIPQNLWSRSTGGCSEASGSYHLTFNHYRPEKETRGLNEHRDDGFTTILRTNTPGLQICIDGQWFAAPAESRFFKINFGLTMQILTHHSGTPAAAILHRVVQQDLDRTSWAHFTSTRFDTKSDHGVYSYSMNGKLTRVSGSRDLIDKNDSSIYQGQLGEF